jgi:tripartite-type tricarboxylate transporter receptor subunit TctC
MNIGRRTLMAAALVAACPFTLAQTVAPTEPSALAATQAYPSRPIRLVVGFPSGQAIDGVARFMAQKLSDELKQPVVVDNRAGASGIIAHEHVKGAAPDGYTLLITSGATMAINPALFKKLSYDPLKDFAPIILLNTTPMFLAVNAASPVGSFAEMMAYAKARPGKLAYGSGGSGLTQHIAMEMLKKAADIDLLHVPYKGSPAMVTDLIGGQVQFAFDTSTSILPHAANGRVKLLGVTSLTRSPAAPNVPTLAEQGLPGFEALTWAGLVAPAGTPPAIADKVSSAMNRVLANPATAVYLAGIGATPAGGTAGDFDRFIRKELVRWGKAVKDSGAQVD